MVWGGHNLASFSAENELFYVKFAQKNKLRVAGITIYKNYEIDPHYKFVQSGDVPSGRCAHTLTNCFVLTGGIEFRNRLSNQSLSLFKQFSSDMTFVFVLNIQAFSWKKIPVDGNVTQLAYHTSCFFPDTNKIILTGAIKFKDNKT